MTSTSEAGWLSELTTGVITSNRLIAVAMILIFGLAAAQPAHAQISSSDTWKSVAIIGGSTAAGAIVGHKLGGATGAVIGAGIGASAGYAIDRHRRENEYNNQSPYGPTGEYDPNGGYYGNGGNGGGPYGGASPASGQYRRGGYSGYRQDSSLR